MTRRVEATGRNGVVAERKTATAKKQVAKPKVELSEKWKVRREAMRARNMARHDRPKSAIEVKNGKASVGPATNQDSKLYAVEMLEALGTRSISFLNQTLSNITHVMSPTLNASEQQHNAAIAIMASVEPENELEATLASQMVAANECAMRCMRGMVGTDMPEHHKMYGDLANKFMRTFTAQMEALSRMRRGGEQVVKHVYVGEGGQAVFAKEIHNGRGVNNETSEQAYGTNEPAERASLSGPDPTRDGMPVPGNAEREVSIARRAIDWPAEG